MSMTRGAKMLMVRNETNRGNQTNREYGRMETPDTNYEMRYDGGSGRRNEMRYEGGSGGHNEMRYEMRNEGEMRRGSGGRNDYGEMNYPRNEYGGMNYGESRFRDRRGREHYDNGRFAPMNEMDEMRGDYPDMRRGGSSHYPFGPVPPVYERGNDMNRIGFSMDGDREFRQDYTTNAAYSHMNEMDHRTSNSMMGHARGSDMKLTDEMADEWMRGLHNEDGTKGAHWTKEQVKQVMNQKGIKADPTEVYAVMNALYADYCGVLKKHGVNTIDFYVDMTSAWLNDKDAQEGKTARYFQYITK